MRLWTIPESVAEAPEGDAMPDKDVWTMEQVIPALTQLNAKWYSGAIRYSFYQTSPAHLSPPPPNFAPLSEAQRIAVRLAFDHIEDITTLRFEEVADQAGEQPWIRFLNVHVFAQFSGSASNRLDEGPTPDGIVGSDIVFNMHLMNQRGFYRLGDWNTMIVVHEILHTLGLSHPGPYNGPGYNYQDHAPYLQDTNQYTVMSYWTADNSGASHDLDGTMYRGAMPLLHDIAALQHLYGANMATRTGDTVYGFNSTAGRPVYDIALNPKPIFSIWDAGGTDTLDLSGFDTPSRIDLNQGAFTDTAGLTGNISIAYGAVIENAKGGPGADTLTGNAAANRLEGAAGSDRIDGAAGADSLAGGRGVDSLAGGSGGDVFVFASLGDSHRYAARSDGKKYVPDALTDFRSGEDRIDLSGIDAVWSSAGDDAFTFVGTAAFSGRSGELRYDKAPDRIHIFADVDGNGLADLHIIVMADSIAATDFIL